MKKVNALGIDLAKNVFSLHGVDERGQVVLCRTVRRGRLQETVAKLGAGLIGMEACPGAHYWAREFTKLGCAVRIVAPQFVSPYVKNQKNDAHDAAAIVEAITRPHMRFVPIKQVHHQDIQCTHRIRTRLVANRTRLSNEIRGLLHEYGVVLPPTLSQLRVGLPRILEDPAVDMTDRTRALFRDLWEELLDLEKRIVGYDLKIRSIYREQKEVCDRMLGVPGVGILTATALVAALPNPSLFKNGRQFAASLGLVPRQVSTGGKTLLRGITKHGDRYLRTLLIHGARATIRYVREKDDRRSRWIRQKIETRGINKAAVAVANKNARILWHLLAYQETYRNAA